MIIVSIVGLAHVAWPKNADLHSSQDVHKKARNSHDSSSARARSSRNRHSNDSRSSSLSRTVQSHESPHLASGRGRQDPSLNRHASDMGSLRDAYGKDRVHSKDGAVVHVDGEMDNENWIHRDKLAKIESEELHQAAVLFQRRMRAESKSSAGRGRSHDSHQSGVNGTTVTTTEQTEPWPEVPEEPDQNGVQEEERKNWDLRRPEEIAADKAAASIYSNPGLRKSSSRIPISTASPAPLVPSVSHDSGGARSRAPTDENDNDTDSRGRRASEPAPAEPEASTPSPENRPGSRGTTTPSSPSKKTPAKTTGSTVRKTSAPPANRKPTGRSRAVSGNNGNNSSQRPTTPSRTPTAVNTPEGDPPWLATMYKPDPLLPPDQQMLPTLAKKMQQEQWEKEGRTGITYDRDFAPLAVRPKDEPAPEKPVEPPQPESPRKELPPKPKSPEPARPNTSTGYSTMPKLQDTPPIELTPNPNWNPPVVSAPEPTEKEEKGCGCCIVM